MAKYPTTSPGPDAICLHLGEKLWQRFEKEGLRNLEQAPKTFPKFLPILREFLPAPKHPQGPLGPLSAKALANHPHLGELPIWLTGWIAREFDKEQCLWVSERTTWVLILAGGLEKLRHAILKGAKKRRELIETDSDQYLVNIERHTKSAQLEDVCRYFLAESEVGRAAIEKPDSIDYNNLKTSVRNREKQIFAQYFSADEVEEFVRSARTSWARPPKPPSANSQDSVRPSRGFSLQFNDILLPSNFKKKRLPLMSGIFGSRKV